MEIHKTKTNTWGNQWYQEYVLKWSRKSEKSATQTKTKKEKKLSKLGRKTLYNLEKLKEPELMSQTTLCQKN